MSRESLGVPNYTYNRISFPHSLKTLNSSVFMTKFNLVYVLLHFEVFKERGNDIRYELFGSPRLSRDISTFSVS